MTNNRLRTNTKFHSGRFYFHPLQEALEARHLLSGSPVDTGMGEHFYSRRAELLFRSSLRETPQIAQADPIAAKVTGRHLFYEGSVFDKDSGPGLGDIQAIAPDKSLGLPGSVTTFAQVSTYSRGINGILLDVDHLANPQQMTPSDLLFRTAPLAAPQNWSQFHVSPTLFVQRGGGANGTDRIHVTFPDRTIVNTWLQVTLLATPHTGLAVNDVSYIGSLVGESGDSGPDLQVTLADELGARNNPRPFFRPAEITNPLDFNRDARVDATDEIISRNQRLSGLVDLKAMMTPLPPDPPEHLAADGHHSDEGILLTWDPVPNAIGYHIFRSHSPDRLTKESIGNAASNQFADPDIIPGVTYYYWVSSRSTADESLAVGSVNAARDIVPITQGSAAGYYDSDHGQIFIQVNGVTSWFVESLEEGFTGSSPANLPAAGGTTIVTRFRLGESTPQGMTYAIDLGPVARTGLSALQLYYRTTNGPWRLGNMTFLQRDVPSPRNVAATDGTDEDGVLVEWPKVPGAKGYQVWRSNTQESSEPVAIATNLTQTSFLDGSAKPDVLYRYWVRSVGQNGLSPLDQSDVGSRPVPSSLFDAVADYEVETGVVRITARDVVNWYVQSASQGFNGTPIDATGLGIGTFTSNPIRIGHTALTPFAYSNVSLGAVAKAGLPVDDLRMIYTKSLGTVQRLGRVRYVHSDPTVPPVAPNQVTASDGASLHYIDVAWQSVGSQVHYSIWRSSLNDFSTATSIAENLSVVSYRDATAPRGIPMYYWVVSHNAAGASDPSVSDVGIVASVSTPTGVTASDLLGQDHIDVTWQTTPGAAFYEIWRGSRESGLGRDLVGTVTSTETTFADGTAPAGILHYYWVRARNEIGASAFSQVDVGAHGTASIGMAPGVPLAGTAIATYSPDTGQIFVSVNSVVNWFIESRAHGLTGNAPANLPAGGGFLTDNDFRLGETTLTPISYTGIELGSVAALHLPPNDLTLSFNSFLGSPVNTIPVVFIQGPVSVIPQLVSASDGTFTDRVVVTWAKANEATSYRVWRGTTADRTAAVIVASEITDLRYEDLALAPGKPQYYWVQSITPQGESVLSQGDSGLSLPVPERPDSVTATTNRIDRVDLRWASVPNAAWYDVYRGETNDLAQSQLVGKHLTDRFFEDTEIAAGNSAYYWVRAVNRNGESPYSNVVQGTRLRAGIVSTVNASDGELNSIRVTWSAAFGATSYEIWRNQAFDLSTAEKVGTATTLGFIDNAVETGDYYYWVRGVSPLGAGPFGAFDKGYATIPLLAPQNVQATDGSLGGRVEVTWNAVSTADSYDIYRAPWGSGTGSLGPASQGTAIASYNPNTGELIISSGGAVNVFVQSASGNLTPLNPPITPPIGLLTNNASRVGITNLGPMNLVNYSFGNIGKGLLASDLSFIYTPALGQKGIIIAAGAPGFRYDTGFSEQVAARVTALQFNDETAQPNIAYQYWVTARRGSAASDRSTPTVGFVMPIDPQFGVATAIQATDELYLDRIDVTWKPVNFATGYDVYRGTSPDVSQARFVSALNPTNTFRDTNVVGQQTYYYWVVTRVDSFASGFSASDSGLVMTPLIAPTNLEASDGTFADRVHLTWNAVPNATSYDVFRGTTGSVPELGPAESGAVIAKYDPSTGDLYVSSGGAVNWFVESASGKLTPLNPPITPPVGLLTNVTSRVGITNLGPINLTNFHMGKIGANLEVNDLTLNYTPALGQKAIQIAAGSPGFFVGSSTTRLAQGITSVLFDDMLAIPNVIYNYTVIANSHGFTSPTSIVESGYRGTDPTFLVPTDVSASDGTSTSKITVSWSAPSLATSYDIYRSTASDPLSAIPIVTNHVSITFVDTNVVPGQLYYYWVKGRVSTFVSEFSAPDTGQASVPLNAPSGVNASDGLFADRVHVSWDAVSNATSYDVLRTEGSDGVGTVPLPGDAAPGTVRASYNPQTGAFVVSSGGAVNFYIESISGKLTPLIPLPSVPVGLWTNNANRIGLTNLGPINLTNFVLGNIGVGLDPSDLRLFFSPALGSLQRKLLPGTDDFSVGSVQQRIATGVTATEFNDLTAMVGRVYSYKVVARNAIDSSPSSGFDVGFVTAPLPTYDNLGVADLNQDGAVDALDASLIFAEWESTTPRPELDLNQDGTIDAADAEMLFAVWTSDTSPLQRSKRVR